MKKPTKKKKDGYLSSYVLGLVARDRKLLDRAKAKAREDGFSLSQVIRFLLAAYCDGKVTVDSPLVTAVGKGDAT